MQAFLPEKLWKVLPKILTDCQSASEKLQLNDDLTILRAEKARHSWPVFSEFVLQDETGEPIELAPLHLSWMRHIEYCWSVGVNPGILSPRGHGKTQQIIALVLYELGRNPNLRIKIVCNVEKEAIKRVALVGRYVERSPEWEMVFPDVKPAQKGHWTSEQLYVQRTGYAVDPSVEAKAVLATGVGGRSDLLIFDDPVDFQNSISSVSTRERVYEAIMNVWMNTLMPDGRICWISTAWHQKDATHIMMRNPSFCFLVQRVSQDFSRIESEII